MGAAYFVCCRSWLNHIVYYNGEHSTFLYGEAFRDEYVAANGLAAYVDSWLSAMMASDTIGPLILALLCAAVYWLADALIRAVTRRPDVLGLSVGASILTFMSTAGIDRPLTPAWAVPLCLAAALIIAAIINRLTRRGPVKPYALLRGKDAWVWTIAVVAWGAFGYMKTLNGINLSERAMLLTERAAREGRYDEVITRADNYIGSGHTNMLMSLLRNHALAQKGVLADHLLDYPMPFGAEGLSFGWKSDSRQSEYGSLVYEAVGHINEAYRWESEALVVWGATPRRLSLLARYNIAMGRPDAARKYIRLLAKAPFRADEAAELMRVADDPEAAGVRYSLREVGQEPAKWANVSDITPELEAICAADPGNEVARQYLLCELLLRNKVTRFAELLPVYGPKDRMPRLYLEALTLEALRPGADPATAEKVPDAMKARFRNYAMKAQRSPAAIMQAEYGDTYWFYLNYLSPYGKTAE